VLGIAALILGPMLGVFLLGMFTRSRGSDRGNMIAITLGLVVTSVLGELHIHLANLFVPAGGRPFTLPDWLPQGVVHLVRDDRRVVVLGSGCSSARPRACAAARYRASQAHSGEDAPLALRGDETGGRIPGESDGGR